MLKPCFKKPGSFLQQVRRCDSIWFTLLVSVVGVVIPLSAKAAPVLWIEAEKYAEQRGSTAPKYAMSTASGGACVDNDWGGRSGDFLRYKLEVATDFPTLHLAVRYARQVAGESVIGITLDDDTNTTRIIKLPSTGDWGFQPHGWKCASVQLPAIAKGAHRLELRSLADRNNVNFDGFYVTQEPLDTTRAKIEPPSGSDAIAPLGDLFPLPCRTPLALPYSRQKAYVAGNGLIQALLGSEKLAGMGGNVPGPSLHVLLTGHGSWTNCEQTMLTHPVPTVVTRFYWPDIVMEQRAFAASPETSGWFLSVSLTNLGSSDRRFEVLSLLKGIAEVDRKPRSISANGRILLRTEPGGEAKVSTPEGDTFPGPLGAQSCFQHQLTLAPGKSGTVRLQFLGSGPGYEEAFNETARFWERQLHPAAVVQLPDSRLQYAFDASLRQMLMLIESRPGHARMLKGLQHYYGSNPYDTFQGSRALDAVGLRRDAEELLQHQMAHLKHDGLFEMWETGQLDKRGTDQWIVQGLAATALWNHYELWRDEAWLREIAPTLIQAAQATTRILRSHAGPHKQGNVEISGWLPPIGGDGGLGQGYHWSQNAGPIAGLRFAAEAARRLKLPEMAELQQAHAEFQRAMDTVRQRSVEAAGLNMIPAFPGAEGANRTRPLWGAVMSVSAFGAIPPEDPGALGTLRFLQTNLYGGLHLNLGYSRGTWPYLSAETALWHLQLGEAAEAWRILQAMVKRASSTVCWYEEIDHAPPGGHGDSADVWAAAECVYLTRQLLAHQRGEVLCLASGLPADWMRPGKELKAENLPTRWGACAYQLHFSDRDALAEITLPAGDRPKEMWLCLAPSDQVPWEHLEVTGAPAHRHAGRDLILERPGRQVRVKLRF